MSWTIAIGEPGAGLRALAGDRTLVDGDRADVILWPARRHRAMPVGTMLNVVDLRGLDPAETVDLVGAGLLLVSSATAYGAWAVRAGAVPLAVVAPVAEAAATASTRFTTLHILTGPDCQAEAVRAADWAAIRGMDCGIEPQLPPIGPGALVLDLRTGAGRIDAAPALLALMAAGAPVLFIEDTPLRLTIEGAGAGSRCESVEAGLIDLAGWSATAFERMSAAALRFVATRFTAAAAIAAFERAVDGALAQPPAPRSTIGHILVVSDEGPNLRHIRVNQPFDAMLRAGTIAGYSVLHRGTVVHSTVVQSTGAITPSLRFGAIWVQRGVDPAVQLLLRVIDRPFVYDLDDHLLLSPSYRPAFEPGAIEVARALIRDSAVLSCATTRLAAAFPDAAGKAVVTPNLAYAPPMRSPGMARTVVWASSDIPALAASRREVERAVRDFCRTHGLDLLCIGSPPPPIFAAAGLRVEHVGLLPYPAYLDRLRAASPGILVAPLETAGDPDTQAFVDAKSDIKVIEAAMSGLVGVFSRAAPYARSDLTPEILCDNDYESWKDGLARARAECLTVRDARPWPGRRDAAGPGLLPWADALRRAPVDVSMGEITAALRFVRVQTETLLTTPAAFDEADYRARHPDVAAAVSAGALASGYDHFVKFGFREGRGARSAATPAGDAAFWWSRLLHETSTLEASVAARERQIASLKERLARSPPAPAPVDRPRMSDAILPCPICAATGPHAFALSEEPAAPLRCGRCGTCFYPDRTEHEYAIDPTAELALQFTLEQNASIHHQTRLLFGGPATSVLDVGCGFGFAVDMAAAVLGWRAVGVDPSATAASGHHQLGADIRQEMLTSTAALGAPFDRVIASEVLEHVTDPYAMIALLRARLAPGGTLAITTPNAAAIQPGADRGRLLGILAPGIHLTLFTEQSLETALGQAGFTHIAIEATADTLIAEASDRPLQPASPGHAAAYRSYLEGLLDRSEPASALWNGAAGRLLTLLVPTAAPTDLDALFDRIAAAWQDRFGLDLTALPPPLSEAEIRTIGAASLGRRQPFNLATVLSARADMADRMPHRAPEELLRWAAPAYRIAVETRRVLQAENLVDLDLKRTAWRQRLTMLRCLSEMAPELAGTLMQSAGIASPGVQADWDDAPDDAIIGFVAPFFAAAAAADRFDEARRVASWVADADRVVAALADDPGLLLRTLFMRGVHALIGNGDPVAAVPAFELLASEARRLGAADYVAIAREHVALAGGLSAE